MNEQSSLLNGARERPPGVSPVLVINTAGPPPIPRWRRSRFWAGMLAGLILAWSGAHFWREPPVLDTALVHPDRTGVTTRVERQVPAQVTLVYENQAGELVRVLADAGRYSEFVRIHTANLEQGRQQLRERAREQLAAGLETVFTDLRQRIPAFADWYYAYGTSYQLLWEALTSAFHHLGEEQMPAAVAASLEQVIQQHYELLVLKPEITDPRLQEVYQTTLDNARQSYLLMLTAMQAEFQIFVAQHTTHLEAGKLPAPELHLDWSSQLHKVRIASDANSALGAFRGITLTTLSAMAGKALGSQVGLAVASRLSLPFAERVLLAITGGTTGGVSGSLGGPVGATVGVVVGAGAGLATDWLIQQGVELLSRDAFEAEIQIALESTQQEWQRRLLPSLLDTVDVWVDDTIQLLPQFKPQ
ncbi:MAG TPA: hypothetical protein P5149_04360 [Candidatus Competibacteraceae bacterium]|nr:hypothetical protein [Candidatus Competibacteraceae bacterium]